MNTIEYWAGKDGDEYHQRQTVTDQANVRYFANALGNYDPASAIELGCGDGRNMKALLQLHPMMRFTGVDVNEGAVTQAAEYGRALCHSIDHHMLRVAIPPHDLVYTKGVLIHIPTGMLPHVYDNLYHLSNDLILIGEYYAPQRTEILYRGQTGKLWKADFAGELMDRYPDLKLIDYGFHYHRDFYPQDDINWFLMSKGGRP
jgi:pseudaminic acid biosynthesis-associated methylase